MKKVVEQLGGGESGRRRFSSSRRDIRGNKAVIEEGGS